MTDYCVTGCFVSTMFGEIRKPHSPHDCLTTVRTVYSLQPNKQCEPFLLGRITFGLCLFHGTHLQLTADLNRPAYQNFGIALAQESCFLWESRQFVLLSPQDYVRERVSGSTDHTDTTGRRLSAQYSRCRYVVKTSSL